MERACSVSATRIYTRTYIPGLPVQVEKLKKYKANPTALPGEVGVPENASRVWA